jgi:hypothetical protein
MPSEEERFWSRVEKTKDCWLWIGHVGVYGYGYFGPRFRTTFLAHRYSYALAFGPIPDKMSIDHLCCNRLCVNPAHLEAISPSENSRRVRLRSQAHAVAVIRELLARPQDPDVRARAEEIIAVTHHLAATEE